MRTIDAHHHLWGPAACREPWLAGEELRPLRRGFTPAELAAEAAAAGVDTTVVVQTVSRTEETSELLALAARGGRIAGVVGWVDLSAPDVADAVAALREGPGGAHLVGIRHQVQDEADPQWLERPEVLRGLRAVARAALGYDLLVRPHQFPSAVAAVDAVPELAFTLDHLGKPPVAAGGLGPWAAGLSLLAERPNVTAKLSGLVTEADWQHWSIADLRPFADTALHRFGPGRLMFGSDWPVCTLAAPYGEVLDAARALTAELTEDERAAVLGGTAARVYGV
ncbi:amidohydrolase family protein [Kitasatospora sp. NPDC057223]|uniref:amidohydrolase family protein n=1 Tax=Kitasatospora sp. NPDC057223 TaxID=3346055 RepID=UPI00363D447C